MVDFILFAFAKEVRGILDQVLLATGDLGRVNVILDCKFRDRTALIGQIAV